MTINLILSRIIVRLLIAFMLTVGICLWLYFTPSVTDRQLSTALLIIVLWEWETEFALWAFTYQGMRKTEAPLADLQKFSTLTKEGWRRAEMVMDITSPVFAWLEDVWRRMGFGWKAENGQEPTKVVPPAQRPPSFNAEKAIGELTDAVKELTVKLGQHEKLLYDKVPSEDAQQAEKQ